MGCNCKSNQKMDDTFKSVSSSNESLTQRIIKYTLKSLAFLVVLIMLPIINLFIIWIIFKMLVLNKEINIKPLLFAIGKKFKENNYDDDDEDDDFDSLTEDDVVMVDVEDITNKQN